MYLFFERDNLSLKTELAQGALLVDQHICKKKMCASPKNLSVFISSLFVFGLNRVRYPPANWKFDPENGQFLVEIHLPRAMAGSMFIYQSLHVIVCLKCTVVVLVLPFFNPGVPDGFFVEFHEFIVGETNPSAVSIPIFCCWHLPQSILITNSQQRGWHTLCTELLG